MGNLTRKKFGLSMPVNSPLYSMPVYFEGVESFWVEYETEVEAVNEFLPEGLDSLSPAEASLVVLNIGNRSSVGPYKEAAITIACKWEGEIKRFIAQQFVTADAAMAAGREPYGCPKKIGHIEITHENEIMLGIIERPRNKRICTVSVLPEKPVGAVTPMVKVPTVNLKVIPSVDEKEKFSSVELIEYEGVRTNVKMWECKGDITFDSPSIFDPWYKIPVKKIKKAYYSTFDYMMPFGRVIKKY